MPVQKPREIAARILQEREKAVDYVENLLEARLPGCSGPDRNLCLELVYGVVRWQRTLDWLIAHKTGGRAQKATLQILLRLGLYQMLWLDRIPEHAAVNESVDLARQLGCGPQSGFVNALLRGYARERDQTRKQLEDLKRSRPALGYSHPDWLCERWQRRWGAEKLRLLLEWNNTPPKIFARLNTLRADAGGLLEQWRQEGVEYDVFRRDWFGENLVFELKSHPSLASLASFQQGLYYVQDPSTLLAVQALDPQPHEAILDLCAAPGGKTTYIAQRMLDRGRLVACAVDSRRLQLLRENRARLGITCMETVATTPSHLVPLSDRMGEGSGESVLRSQVEPFAQEPTPDPSQEGNFRGADEGPLPSREGSAVGQFMDRTTGEREKGDAEAKQADPLRHSALRTPQFDRVLVDTPCSNTGVMRRRVDLRWRLRPEEIDRLHSTQLELLRNASRQTRPGGVLVYSTCSLEPEENCQVVKEFTAGQPDFKLEGERELLPFADRVDGAYVARLVRLA